jgi:hypothetical protein
MQKKENERKRDEVEKKKNRKERNTFITSKDGGIGGG